MMARGRDGEMAREYVARPGLSAAIGLVVIALALTSACAARGFTPPSGPEVAEPDAPKIWAAVTARCQGVRLYVAELRVNGWAGADRQTFAATMHGAVTRAGDAYLEVPAPLGGPVLQLAGRAGDATFVLPRDRRVLQAPTREIVAALTGLRWGPEQLLDVLSGCVAAPGQVSGARVGRSLQIDVASGVRVWLQPHDGAWRVRAARIDGWLVEYLRHADVWPAHVRVTASSPTPLDITFAAAKVQTNIELPDTAFVLTAPAGYEPLTLDELRAIGPLREKRTSHSALRTSHSALRTPHSALRTE